MKLRKVIKKTQEIVYKPLLLWYLRKDRWYHTEGLKLIVRKGVFHPGMFYSTSILLNFMKSQDLTGKTLLEPGCGTGLISVWAASKGAAVTAFDINPMAIENTIQNGLINKQSVNALESNLFSKIIPTAFDYILVNPPFYPRVPKTTSDYAWYCGEDFEYFRAFFKDLSDYMHKNSMVMMVLSEDCDVKSIESIADTYGMKLQLFSVSKSLLETGYLFRIFSK